MNYSPDYPMRRRNQDCGCNHSSMPDFRPSAPRNRSRNECGCNSSEPDGGRPQNSCGCNDFNSDDRRPQNSCGCNDFNSDGDRLQNSCGCRKPVPGKPLPPPPLPQPACPDTCAVGMAYVPWQVWRDLYNLEEALPIGTIFRELDYPWEVGKCAGCR